MNLNTEQLRTVFKHMYKNMLRKDTVVKGYEYLLLLMIHEQATQDFPEVRRLAKAEIEKTLGPKVIN